MNILNKLKTINTKSLTLLAIIFFGFFLRVYKLNEQSYWIDEGYTLNAVISNIEKAYPILDSGEAYDRAILNTYLISGSVFAFGFNEVAVRIISVLFGILTVYLIFLISKKILNGQIAILASFMTAFSYWQIAWSRQARMYTQLQFFFFLSLYLFNSLFEKFSYKKLTLLFLSTLAAILSHYFAYFLLLIYFMVIFYRIYSDKELKNNLYQKIKKNIYLFSSISLAFFYTFYRLGEDFLDYFMRKTNNHFFEYLFFIRDFFPVLCILAILGFVVLLIKDYKNKNKLGGYLLLFLSFAIPFLTIAIISDRKIFRYVFFITPIIFIFSSYFIYHISEKTRKKKLTFIALSSLIIIMVSVLNVRTFNFLPKSHYYLEPSTPQPNFKGAYQEIKKENFNDEMIIISPYTPMDKIYLGKTDYCLAMNLAGGETEEADRKERDYYNNAINIFKEEELERIINNNKGYIVIDYMATKDRLNQEIINFIFEQELMFKDEYDFNNQIWVFKF